METSDKLKIGKELQSRPDLVEYIKEFAWASIHGAIKHYAQGAEVKKSEVDAALDLIISLDEETVKNYE
jgi:hypothetical protein